MGMVSYCFTLSFVYLFVWVFHIYYNIEWDLGIIRIIWELIIHCKYMKWLAYIKRTKSSYSH